MKSFRLSRMAERDLDQIWNYFAEEVGSTEAADELADTLSGSFALFASAPGLGTTRYALGRRLRAFPVGNYLVYYREMGNQVVIARVIHGKRDQRRAFRSH